ncbi:MAG TPA: hypothetical protein VFE60_17390 [Roseiarcus sp.]|jgi:hypothetical protein|nr:hypothetical protein [Roseiarcus sp.]
MDFVFMLTRNGATVADALALVEIARPLRLRHIGFKDVGADASMLQSLTAATREAGASPWMEIVSTTREAELRGVALGRDLGVDWLLGGVHVDEALRILEGSAIRYLPFAGAPSGHPTRLGGAVPEVEAQCRNLAAKGCAGVDILAYRATEGRAARPRRRLPPRISQFRRGRGRGERQFAGTGRSCPPGGSGRLHHRHRGDRGVLRAWSRAAGGAARSGPRRLRPGGVKTAALYTTTKSRN